MKRRRLRGLLLVLSIVLCSTGGMALAQGIEVTLHPDCIEPECGDAAPEHGRFATLTYSGHVPAPAMYGLDLQWSFEGEFVGMLGFVNWPPADPGEAYLFASCLDGFFYYHEGGETGWIRVPVPWQYGEWTVTPTYFSFSDETVMLPRIEVRVEEECAPEEIVPEPEFIPEPGPLLLLGSGLASLAGYATLRWRARG
jgi:hypothetical protein